MVFHVSKYVQGWVTERRPDTASDSNSAFVPELVAPTSRKIPAPLVFVPSHPKRIPKCWSDCAAIAPELGIRNSTSTRTGIGTCVLYFARRAVLSVVLVCLMYLPSDAQVP